MFPVSDRTVHTACEESTRTAVPSLGVYCVRYGELGTVLCMVGCHCLNH